MAGLEGGYGYALELRSVTKVLGGRAVVDDFSIQVSNGELICILGPSGCGKTTTLRMLGGFIRPDAGQILIAGKDMTATGPEERPTAMVFQNYALWPHMTVLRNVTFGLRARKVTRVVAQERAEKALDLLGLTGRIHALPAALSGGEQQRVALARALVLDPAILLMDEPLSNLDAQLRLRVREELLELQRKTGVTMILVTHDQDEALSIADRVAVMQAGRLEQVGPPEVVYQDPATAFVAGFVGRENVVAGEIIGGNLVFPGVPGSPQIGVDALVGGSSAGIQDGPVRCSIRPEKVLVISEGRPGECVALLYGQLQRYSSRGHFAEVLIDTVVGTLRAYVEPEVHLEGVVGVTFDRVMLYREDRLIGTAFGTRAVAAQGTSSAVCASAEDVTARSPDGGSQSEDRISGRVV